jgi:hypothetical protein
MIIFTIILEQDPDPLLFTDPDPLEQIISDPGDSKFGSPTLVIETHLSLLKNIH